MAGEADEEAIKKLAESAMPGWTVIPEQESGVRPESGYSDQLSSAGIDIISMPSLEDLKSKYLDHISGSRDSSPAAQAAETDPDLAVVNLQNGPLTKSVALSKSSGSVRWTQG